MYHLSFHFVFSFIYFHAFQLHVYSQISRPPKKQQYDSESVRGRGHVISYCNFIIICSCWREKNKTDRLSWFVTVTVIFTSNCSLSSYIAHGSCMDIIEDIIIGDFRIIDFILSTELRYYKVAYYTLVRFYLYDYFIKCIACMLWRSEIRKNKSWSMI